MVRAREMSELRVYLQTHRQFDSTDQLIMSRSSLLAYLCEASSLLPHVVAQSHKIKIGGYKDQCLFHELSTTLWQNLQEWSPIDRLIDR